MLIFRLITLPLALPPFWIGQLLGAFHAPACIPFLKTAWWISRNDQIGLTALRHIQHFASPEDAASLATRWLASNPRPGMACFAGLAALDAGDLEKAARMRDLCRKLGGDREGFIDWLDLHLAGQVNDSQTLAELYKWMDRRTDLTPAVTKKVLDYYLVQALQRKDWDEVERRAKHLTSIEDAPLTATAFWVLDRQRGKTDDIQKYLKNVKLNPAQVLFFQSLGLFMSGDLDLARQSYDVLCQEDALLADSLQNMLVQMGAAI
jgi:hypothetical protein